MTNNLHDVLEKTAGLAGSASFDADALWKRGSRAKHRSVALSVLSVVAVLMLVSLSVWWGTGTTAPRPAGPPTTTLPPAVPSTLFAPPDEVQIVDDLRIGVTASVFVSPTSGSVVAVSALDGSYRGLRLPGYDELSGSFSLVRPALAVSPNGRLLAYPWHATLPATSGSHVASGVRIVDLMSGYISTHRVNGGLAALCGGIAWSPSARYLAYSCELQEAISVSESNAKTGQILRLDLRTQAQTVLPLGRWLTNLATVNDSGEMAVADGSRVDLWTFRPQTHVQRVPVSVDSTSESVVSTTAARMLVVAGREFSSGRPDGVGVQVIAVGDHVGQVRHLGGVGGWVLGSVGSSQAAVWVVRPRGGDVYLQSRSGDLVHSVHFAGPAPSDSFSIATDLLSKPTRDMPDPNALTTWDHGKQVLPYLSVGALLLLTVLVVVVVGRRGRMLRQA